MKKYAFFLLASLALGACEQYELDEFLEEEQSISTPLLETKAIASLSDFDQITELIGLPLNVLNVGNSTFKYLSTAEFGDKIDLHDQDDASGRQRWYLQMPPFLAIVPQLTLKKGNSFCNGSNFVYMSAHCQDPSNSIPEYPTLKEYKLFPPTISPGMGAYLKYHDDVLTIDWGGIRSGSASQLYQLKSVSNDSRDLRYLRSESISNPDSYSQWFIVPVGEFKVVDIQYEKNAAFGDYITPKSVYCEGIVVDDLPVSITREVSIQKTFTTSSRFTETSNVVTQNQNSFSWSLGFGDVSLVHIGFDGSIDNSVTNEQSVSYENYEENTTTITKGYTLQIAPHTPCRIEILKMTYNASLTYVLTLEKVGGEESGKRFRIKGKWDGVVLSDLYFRRSTVDGNTELETQLIPENAQTVQIGY